MLKRPNQPIKKDLWMTTYSDMTTLLLCFFVLLFAASTVDNAKWQILVRSLNPNASVVSQIVNEMSEGEYTEMVDTEGEALLTDAKSFDQLYWQMRRYVEENSMAADVEVAGGDGYTFITFKNNILFDGDKYNLRPDGMAVLDFLCRGVSEIGSAVKEMRILGHTNQADPNNPNDVRGDRFLASNRAAEVLVYIQEKNIMEPQKLVSIGYGQFYPVRPFVEEEDRLQNRRVEILITEADAVDVSLEQVYAQISAD
ncbi:MAG: OmpA family protein [Clostridiales bacterium]|nr:OmpA family protein [Clostridiales bacterium]